MSPNTDASDKSISVGLLGKQGFIQNPQEVVKSKKVL